MSRLAVVVVAALGGAALLGGCHTCENHEGAENSFELAKFNYENGKYDQAEILYTRCVEQCPAHERGWLGLGNSARENGNDQYKNAAELAGQGKIQDSKRVFKEASENHRLSYEIFQKHLKEHPEDL